MDIADVMKSQMFGCCKNETEMTVQTGATLESFPPTFPPRHPPAGTSILYPLEVDMLSTKNDGKRIPKWLWMVIAHSLGIKTQESAKRPVILSTLLYLLTLFSGLGKSLRHSQPYITDQKKTA